MRHFLVLASFVTCSLLGQEVVPVTPPGAPPVPAVPDNPAKYATAAAAWFPVLDQVKKATREDTMVTGVFRFQNPRDGDIEWRQLTASCACSHAVIVVGQRRYEMRPQSKDHKLKELFLVTGTAPEQAEKVQSIPIHRGETGQVDVHVETRADASGGLGVERIVSLDIHTTDPLVPMMRLQLRAEVPKLVTATPPEVALGAIAPGEVRAFTVGITSLAADFAITGDLQLPPGVAARYERDEATGGFVIHGTFQTQQAGEANGVIRVSTNQKLLPVLPIKVFASVRDAVSCKPAFLAVGRVAKGAIGSAKVTITAADGRSLTAVAMRVENLSIDGKFVTLHATKEGLDLVVELQVAADAPTGLLRGEVVVEIDHPTVKQQRILFNAFVR